MKRLKKEALLPVRACAYQWNHLRVYYWAERELFELHAVSVMPIWYYRFLYHVCMRLVVFKRFHMLTDRAIHTIPYHIRLKLT